VTVLLDFIDKVHVPVVTPTQSPPHVAWLNGVIVRATEVSGAKLAVHVLDWDGPTAQSIPRGALVTRPAGSRRHVRKPL
jgi:hypothetical protein